jgi:hypothetical protein
MTGKNVIRLPYAVAPRTWINKLVSIGYLRVDQKRDPVAIEKAVRRLREYSKRALERDFPP